jgi:hypothetical protein
VTTTMYLSSGVLEQLSRAQEELERHLVSTPGGHCQTCGEEEPCRARLTAGQPFARYGRPPRRTPEEVGRVLLGWSR